MNAIPWDAVAALAAAAVLVLSLPRALRAIRGPRAARQRKASDWTRAQRFLVAVLIVLGIGITIPAFIEIYLTVTHLIRPAFGYWSWTVPVSGEIAFTWLFINGALLAMRRAPAGVMRSLLMAAIVAGSVILQIWAYLGSVPAVVGHLLIVGAFFGVLLAGKETGMTLRGGKVRPDRITPGAWIAQPLRSASLWRWMKIWAEPSRKAAHERYMRLLFAFTVAKSDPRIGRCRRFWSGDYWRKHLPDILRYQFATGDLPQVSGEGWQEAVAAHVMVQLEKLPPVQPEGSDEGTHEDTPRDSDGGTVRGSTRRRPKGTPESSSWPQTKDINKAVLARRVEAACEKYERENQGKRLPAAKLSARLKVRMNRETAGKLLAAAYGTPDASQHAGVR